LFIGAWALDQEPPEAPAVDCVEAAARIARSNPMLAHAFRIQHPEQEDPIKSCIGIDPNAKQVILVCEAYRFLRHEGCPSYFGGIGVPFDKNYVSFLQQGAWQLVRQDLKVTNVGKSEALALHMDNCDVLVRGESGLAITVQRDTGDDACYLTKWY
jgi:hypothetical protein